ncbi:MAG: hypothetical protein UX94_C0001G0014 [Parcubacteria group bacterium GW2011_GWA2_47_21]|nr:MAG: hypothetical protein UX94_C0001G0014 [Parcubacteria group bacterium GW2011_GWA2_47_21]
MLNKNTNHRGRILVTALIVVGLVGLMAYFDINARELADKATKSPAGAFVMTNFDKAKKILIPVVRNSWTVVADSHTWSAIQTFTSAFIANIIYTEETQSE